jgi:autotransporter family porin
MNPLKPNNLPKILAFLLAVMLGATSLAPDRLVQAQEGAELAAADKPYKTYLPYTARPGLSVTRFATLPPGSKLPTEAECAASVKSKPENKRMNKTYNATKGSQTVGKMFADGAGTSIYNARITGNFSGTTDEILQWAACKWGIDEDIVRAQAAKESWWQMTAKGDWTTDASRCAPGHGLGIDGTAGQCPESFGILQNRYIYEQDSWPGLYNSTAFNADVAYGYWRACYEGYTSWLGSGYVKGDQWGCVGRWFAGAWHTSWADWYINEVQTYLKNRVWEQAGFQEP